MGDYRITIDAVGGHGCGREAFDGQVVNRCGDSRCPDCLAIAFVASLKATGNTVNKAYLEHWPTQNGPVDDLLTGVREGSFRPNKEE